MKLQDLFTTIVSSKIIQVDLYNNNDLLLITFDLPGYDALDDYLLEQKVEELEILTLTHIKVKLDKIAKASATENFNEIDDEF